MIAMGLLQGKRALITGGTTGLGLAVARRFLAEGAQVVITGRDLALGGQAEQALGPGARFTAADAGDPAAVAASVSAAAEHLGGLDVLVNNAGVGVTARLVDTPLADYDRVMNVNVRGYLLYAQHAYPHLARRRGCMIHIASDAGIWGEQATGLYSVTKAAVVMLGKMLALDGGRDGVRSNVLCPGDIWPGMRHMAPPGEQASTKQDRAESADGWPVPPIGRVGQASDVADAAVFYRLNATWDAAINCENLFDKIYFITGATGSGKTTTLAAILNEINTKQPVHIVTLEDPIEFVHPTLRATFNQRELGHDFNNYPNGLRAALRQAPKVILVGEMRDRATVEDTSRPSVGAVLYCQNI